MTQTARFGDYHLLTMVYNFTCAVKFTNNRFSVYKPVNASYEHFLYKGVMQPKNWNTFEFSMFSWTDSKYYACLDAANALIPEL